jgi:flavodoxin I
MIPNLSLQVIFASTSGHTEYVIEALINALHTHAPSWQIQTKLAEQARPQDLLREDILLLASGTWNTGGVEGQLNPYMLELLQSKAKDLDLAGEACGCIGLGDHRYFYEARAADFLENYVETHQGRLLIRTLKIIDEPYGQERMVGNWAQELVTASLQLRGLQP